MRGAIELLRVRWAQRRMRREWARHRNELRRRLGLPPERRWRSLATLLAITAALTLKCTTPASRGPVDEWVTGEDDYTDTGVGCVLDCLAPTGDER